MASDVMFDECAVDKLDLNGDIFMTGGLMNPKELYLTDLVCSKDASSSDSGISTLDDLQDIANVTDLNGLMHPNFTRHSSYLDTDLKDLDFSLDFTLSKIEQDDVFDPGVLIKTEPLSPSPSLSGDSSQDGVLSRQEVSPDYHTYPNDITIKEETSPLILPAYNHQQQQYDLQEQCMLSSASIYSPQQAYLIEPSSPSSSSSSASPSPTSCITSPQGLTSPFSYIQQQPLPKYHQQHSNNLQATLSHNTSDSPHHTALSSTPQHSYIVVPNIKVPHTRKESKPAVVPIVPSQPGILLPSSSVDQKLATPVNIDAILNSKIKIQPKPGSDVVSPPAGVQWMTTTTSPSPQVPYTSQAIPIFTSSSIISGSGITDEKSLKRAQRIIKNRESASLSRKRKKEYLSSLEEHLQLCRDENDRLVKENEILRQQVECLQMENLQLKQPSGLSSAKKVCIMCFAFLLALNLSPVSLFTSPGSSISQSGMGIAHHSTGRHLLSLSDDVRVSRFGSRLDSEDGAWSRGSFLQFDEELNQLAEKMNLTVKLGNMCPMYFNSTESMRLAEQLRGWMISQEEEKKKNKEKKRERKKKAYPPLQRFGSSSNPSHAQSVPNREVNGSPSSGNIYPIQVFSGGYDTRQQLLNAIPRRNDTFYVLSFSTDYFLIPATAHNKTMRPRMSLLMPVVTPSLNESTGQSEDSVGMMQIDCEILNTNLIHVHRSAFPDTPLNSTSYDAGGPNHGSSRGNNGTKAPHNNAGKRPERYWERLRKPAKQGY